MYRTSRIRGNQADAHMEFLDRLVNTSRQEPRQSRCPRWRSLPISILKASKSTGLSSHRMSCQIASYSLAMKSFRPQLLPYSCPSIEAIESSQPNLKSSPQRAEDRDRPIFHEFCIKSSHYSDLGEQHMSIICRMCTESATSTTSHFHDASTISSKDIEDIR